MNAQELFELVIADFEADKMHPLHMAIFEECCEKAINNEQGVMDKDTLVLLARIAFLTSNSLFKETIKAALEHADIVNLNYRGVSLVLDKDSPLIKN